MERFFNAAGPNQPDIHHAPGAQKFAVDLKLPRKSPDATIAQGLDQTAERAGRRGADAACLLVFDRTPGKSWEDRLLFRVERRSCRGILVWGM